MLTSSVRRMLSTKRLAATAVQRAFVLPSGTRAAPAIRACAFSSEPTIRRPKAIKIKSSEARRRVEPKPQPQQTDALVEQQEYAQAPAEYGQNPFTQPQEPQTLGGVMKHSFFLGVGMSIAFAFVGMIFGRMEEAEETGAYDGSYIVGDNNSE